MADENNIVSLYSSPPIPAQKRVSPVAQERANICKLIADLIADGLSLNRAIERYRRDTGDTTSASTLRRWHSIWREQGASALDDNRKGRQRKTYGWEARAIELWNQPQRPAMSTVALWLAEEGHGTATSSRVARFLKSLPANVGGDNTVRRAGAHHHKQNFTPYVIRDAGVLDVGLIYEGDGHTCDVYVRHPNSGKHYRPELTIWIDVRTHYVAGFWLTESESALTTLFGLSRALLNYNHVPAALHVDPGSGFVNKLISDEGVGWLTRLGIDLITALPGNARGKGLVEGWFRWFEERCGKKFSSFCGHCRTDDALRRIEKSLRTGEVYLPTFTEFHEAVAQYVASYNNTAQATLGDKAPAELWADLDASPVEIPEAALLRPAVERKVVKQSVTLFGRLYRHTQLALLDGKSVVVEYDLQNEAHVWVLLNDKVVCVADLADKKPWLPKSRIDDYRAKREAGRKKRLTRKIAQVEAQERKPIDQAATIVALTDNTNDTNRVIEINPYDCLPEED